MLVLDGPRHDIGAEPGQHSSDADGIADSAEDRMNSRGRDRREELAQIEAHDKALATMRSGKVYNRTTSTKSQRGFVRREMIENVVQDSALDGLQPRTRCLQQTRPTRAFRQGVVGVMIQRAVVSFSFATRIVREPIQFTQ